MIRLFILLLCLLVLGPAGAAQSSPGRNPSNPITLSLVQSRVADGSTDICVAPCTVFFDASGTTDASVTRYPFHEIQYTWSFGDAAGGTMWAYGSSTTNSKNVSYGPEAAHVFENSGTYTVTLTAYDGTNTKSTMTSVTVTNADTYFSTTNTVCVSTSGIFIGCPSGATHASATSDFDATIATYQAIGKRILFRRGESFDASVNAVVSYAGPGLIGSYGSGRTARITASFATSFTQMLQFSGSAKDWRVMDLEFDGTGTPATSIGIDLQAGRQYTLLRLNQHHIGTYCNKAASIDEAALVDSTMSAMTSSPGATFGWFGGTLNGYLALMGNSVVQGGGTTQGHNFRIPGAQKAVISNNTLDQGPGFTAIDMHGYSGVTFNGTFKSGNPTFTFAKQDVSLWVNGAAVNTSAVSGIPTVSSFTSTSITMSSNATSTGTFRVGVNQWTGQYAEKIIISDNKFIGGTASSGVVAIGPQNAQSNEPMRDVIGERNWFIGARPTRRTNFQCYSVSASTSTFRNNLCGNMYDTTDSFLLVDTKNGTGIEPAPNLVWAYNNSFYSSTNSGATMIQWTKHDRNMVAKNNLAYAPNAKKSYDWSTGDPPGVVYDPGSFNPTTCASCNSSNSQMKGTNPNFANSALKSVTDWKPTSGYAIGGGTSVPVLSDFVVVAEPSPRHIGAVFTNTENARRTGK